VLARRRRCIHVAKRSPTRLGGPVARARRRIKHFSRDGTARTRSYGMGAAFMPLGLVGN
jgi:hypothetical protein